MFKTLLIDDEPLARDELASLLNDYDDIDIVEQCPNAVEGIAAIHRHKPDLVFLDISMPRISGMEMLAMLDPDSLPCVVFVTAHDEHAIEAFEKHAFDYLLKPVEPVRLARCIARLRRQHQPRDLSPVMPEQFNLLPCYSGNRLKLLKVDEIEYVYSDLSGVHVATPSGTIHTQLTLKALENRTPLLRCHRQYLIHPEAIAEIVLHDGSSAEIETRSGQVVPVSRRYLKQLKQVLGFKPC